MSGSALFNLETSHRTFARPRAVMKRVHSSFYLLFQIWEPTITMHVDLEIPAPLVYGELTFIDEELVSRDKLRENKDIV